MSAAAKSIPPVWFYDEEGSRLFEEITRLPEYYPTRAERRLLQLHAPAVAAVALADTLVELGAGACDKTRLLLDAMAAHGPLERYLPFDVSDEFLRAAAAGLVDDYPGLAVHAVVGDFHSHLDQIPTGGRRLVAFLGGTIGNLTPYQRRRFLFDLNCSMAGEDHLLIGTDLVKDPARIVAAYDDTAGSHGRLQPQCPARAEPSARGDLRPRPVRARRPVERRGGVDRDAAALRPATRRSRSPTST